MAYAMGDFENETDEGLLVRIQRGDQRAFAALVNRHVKKFHAAAYRMCADTQESEDIVQEAFLKLWSKPESWDPSRGAKFSTWFYRIVTNLAIDKMRRKKAVAVGDVIDVFADTRDSQETELYEKQRQGALENAIQSLPERQKTALNLCFYEGVSNREAADIMGVSVKALESLLVRAKGALKEELSKRGVIVTEPGKRQSYA
ncbi:MAG: sigma-70 family RNA polymerase sigma factor [Alphaproteobacteria bacterium]